MQTFSYHCSCLSKGLGGNSYLSPTQSISIYTQNIRKGGSQQEVESAMEHIQEELTKLKLDICQSKHQGPAQEVKFLGVWWIKELPPFPRVYWSKQNKVKSLM